MGRGHPKRLTDHLRRSGDMGWGLEVPSDCHLSALLLQHSYDTLNAF